MALDTRHLVCGYCGKTDCDVIGRGQHHWVEDSDAYLDAAVEGEDMIQLEDEPVFYDDNEDYIRSLLHGEDI